MLVEFPGCSWSAVNIQQGWGFPTHGQGPWGTSLTMTEYHCQSCQTTFQQGIFMSPSVKLSNCPIHLSACLQLGNEWRNNRYHRKIDYHHANHLGKSQSRKGIAVIYYLMEMDFSGRGFRFSERLLRPWEWYKCRMKIFLHAGDLLVCSPSDPDKGFCACTSQRKLWINYPSNAERGRCATWLSHVNLSLQRLFFKEGLIYVMEPRPLQCHSASFFPRREVNRYMH